MSVLIWISGEKGGTGKSFVWRTLAEYFRDRHIAFEGFETDRSNPDCKRIYGNVPGCKVSVAIFSEGERYEDGANQILNSALNKRVLVNMPAQVFPSFKKWIGDNEILAIAKEEGIQMFYFHVSDGGWDSLKLFEMAVTHFGRDMQFVFVKNYGTGGDDWEAVDDEPTLQALFEQYQVKVMDFPKLIGSATRNAIDAESLSFAKARDLKKFGSIQRQRVKKFLREAYAAFDCLGVFACDPN